MDPNPPNDLVPGYSVTIDIILREPGNAECSQRNEYWLPAERIVYEPRIEKHQYCATDLRTPGIATGPSRLALQHIAEEGLVVPQSPARNITIRSQLVLRQEGTLRYRDMLRLLRNSKIPPSRSNVCSLPRLALVNALDSTTGDIQIDLAQLSRTKPQGLYTRVLHEVHHCD